MLASAVDCQRVLSITVLVVICTCRSLMQYSLLVIWEDDIEENEQGVDIHSLQSTIR